MGEPKVEHRILGVGGPASAAILAKGQALGLPLRRGRMVSRIDGDQGRPVAHAKPAEIGMIADNRPGKDHRPSCFGQGDPKLGPRHEVGGDRMAPTHMPPKVAKRVVLIEEMIFGVEPDEAIGIIDPIAARREMQSGAIGFGQGH